MSQGPSKSGLLVDVHVATSAMLRGSCALCGQPFLPSQRWGFAMVPHEMFASGKFPQPVHAECPRRPPFPVAVPVKVNTED